MLAKLADRIPEAPGFAFEPKWDGFRAIVFRGRHQVYIQSRDLRALDRYFPELHAALLRALPPGCVVDGEIVIATAHGLDFELLQLRLHPAASRVEKLAAASPAAFVAFDLLALHGRDLRALPQEARRARLERALAGLEPALFVTPMTRERAIAEDWLARFEGAGLDGVVAKPLGDPYQPGKRAMLKVKHVRTADCVVAGFRWYKQGPGRLVGSLLLGMYDEEDVLQHVGVCSAFSTPMRKQLARELAPLRAGAAEHHPWLSGAGAGSNLVPGAESRWSRGKNTSWEPLRIERVCEVAYDHMQGRRFRHATQFMRFRADKPPRECRYDQLETARPYELARVFAGRA